MNKTALIVDRRYEKHFAGRLHPERPDRIAVMIDMAQQLSRPDLKRYSPRKASVDELLLCHRPEYVAAVERTAAAERFDFDLDTHASSDTWETALLAVGGALTAAEAVLAGDVHNAFALVRPPGHHALPGRAMGFCFFNNVAILAAWLVRSRGFRRVLVLDWDVHHGNGTQEIFYRTPTVLYMSTHQFPFYPGTGRLDEIGQGDGAGFTVNAPLPATFGDSEYLRIFDDLFLPVARQFNPEFVLISAGFDCHYRDPLGGMRVTEDGLVAMARRMKRLAAQCCDGKLVAVLEGGYDLKALADSARGVIEELGREPDEPLKRALAGERALEIIQRARYFHASRWKFD